jgi:antitoxin component YwqK of YwqJK toxin-antitoxin module
MENIMKVLKITLITILAFATNLNAQLVNQEDSNGKKQGKWVKYFDNNRVKYEGQFHLGTPYGKFTYYFKNGGVKAVSEFSDDGVDANNITYYENGNLMAEGKFVNQKKDGSWKYYLDK